MREIVTVQLGTFANYVGAHFWNLQDEYLSTPALERELSPAVFFRQGSTEKLPYAPRAQIIDLPAAFGSLSLDSGVVLSETPTDVSDAVWDGPIETRREERIEPSKYMSHLLAEEANETVEVAKHPLTKGKEVKKTEESKEPEDSKESEDFDLDNSCKYWCDYSKARLHPRSCTSLRGEHSTLSEFDKFDYGLEITNINLMDDLYDDLRFFVEECDSLGGIHVTCNASDGFTGLGSNYLTRIRDELGPSASVLVFGTNPAPNFEAGNLTPREKTVKLWDARVSEARLMSECIDLSLQYLPLDASCVYGRKYIHPRKMNDYHSSAVLGLCLNVAVSPFQLPDAGFSTGSLLARLRYSSQAIISSMFTQTPVVREGKKAQYTGPVYNRESTTKLSTRSFTSLMKSQVRKRRWEMPSSRINEVVSARGKCGDPAVDLDLDQSINLPVAFPKFFDSRISERGDVFPSKNEPEDPALKECELERISCVAGFATSAVDGSDLLQCMGSVVSQVVRKPTLARNVDKFLLDEVAEKLTNLGCDYSNL